ncbi:hypothetical protein [Caballeronia sp. HLA56]
MGLGMQIDCLGFAGADEVEREAGVGLVRLERVAKDIANCHLSIEAHLDQSGICFYDARLDLVTREFDVVPAGRISSPDLSVAIHQVFEHAVRLLRQRCSA